MGRTIRSTPNNDYAARAKVADNVTHLYQYKFAMMSMAGDFDIVFLSKDVIATMSGDGDEESVTDCNKALSYVPLYALIIEGTSHNVVTGQMTCYYTGSEGVGIKFKQNGNDTDLPICNASGGMWTLSLDKVVL